MTVGYGRFLASSSGTGGTAVLYIDKNVLMYKSGTAFKHFGFTEDIYISSLIVLFCSSRFSMVCLNIA